MSRVSTGANVVGHDGECRRGEAFLPAECRHPRRGAGARKPHAVLVSRLFRPEPAAASFALGAIADGLVNGGFDVTVLTSRAPKEFTVPAEPRLRVRRAPVLRDKAGYVRGYLQYLSFDLPLLPRLLLVRRPDLVISEPPPTTGAVVRLVCALRRVPYAYRTADLWSEAVKEVGTPALVVRALTRVENWVLNGAATLMTVHEGMENRLALRGIRARTRRLGFGIDTDLFRPEGERIEGAGPLFVYAGTASEVHGAEIFVEAFKAVLEKVPSARLVFVGQGEAFGRISEQAGAMPDGAVTVLGRKTPEETAVWLRSAVATLASIKPGPYDFAFPTKVLASAACGTPVIYVGAQEAGSRIEAAGLGVAVAYDVEAVAAAMTDSAEAYTASSESAGVAEGSNTARSTALQQWALQHVSAERLGRRAVEIALEIVSGSRRSRA